MNITSVSGFDLYTIINGREPIKFELDNSGEKTKLMQVSRDELILSNEYEELVKNSDTSSVFDNFSPIGKVFLVQGCSDERLAKYFGDIGKRIDDAYAEGKFTEDEYNELNKGLDEYIKTFTVKNDTARARHEVIKSEMSSRVMYNAQSKPVALTVDDAKERIEYLKKETEKYLDKHGRTDIKSIMEMVSQYRNNLIDLSMFLR